MSKSATYPSFAGAEQPIVSPLVRRERSLDICVLITTLLLAYLPYAEFVADRFGYKVLGYSLPVTVFPTACVLALFLASALTRPKLFVIPGLGAVLMVTIVVLRSAFDISEPDSSMLAELVQRRYLILFPVYIVLIGVVSRSAKFRRWAAVVILVNGAISALIGALQALHIITYHVAPTGEANVENRFVMLEQINRAGGLSAGVNVYAAMLVLSCMAIRAMPRMKAYAKVLVSVIFMSGIVASQTRTAVVTGALVLLTISLARYVPLWRRLMLVGALIVAALGSQALLTSSTEGLRARFQTSFGDDLDIRLNKTVIGWEAVFGAPIHVALGAERSDIILGRNVLMAISDNSYIAILCAIGLPGAILFGVLILSAFRSSPVFKARGRATVFWFVCALTALIHNSVYWDMWLFYLPVVFSLLADEWQAARNARSNVERELARGGLRPAC